MGRFRSSGTDEDVARITEALDNAFDSDELHEVVREFAVTGARLGDESVKATAKLAREKIDEIVDARATFMAQVKATNVDRMRIAMRRAFEKARREGTDPAAAVERSLARQMGIFRRSADGIASQEVTSAWSEAREVALETTLPDAKRWVSRGDRAVRPTHAAVHGQEVPWVGLFDNGLSRPLDPIGPPAEVMGCRCKLVPVYRADDG